MKNTLRLNHAERTIVMDKTFAKFAANTMSAEYDESSVTGEIVLTTNDEILFIP